MGRGQRATPTVNGRHDKPDLRRVGCTSEMGVYLFGFVLIQGHEPVENVVACRGIVRSTLCTIRSLVFPSVGSILVELAFIVREVILHRAHRELLFEPVDLVQEQDDRCLDKPSRVTDGVEQCEGLLHSIDGLVLEEQLIVLGDGNEEKNRCDVLEAVDPLFPLGSLSTHIEHAIGEFTNDEGGLGDSGRLDTRPQYILIVG
jgi:hypothetical protein